MAEKKGDMLCWRGQDHRSRGADWQMNASTEPFWAAAHTYTLQEDRAVKNLRRQGFQAFSPELVQYRPTRRAPYRGPMFPGYLFVQISDEVPWGSINSTIGIIRLLASTHGATGAPVPGRLSDKFISTLQGCLVQDYRGHEVVRTGASVRVLNGPFTGLFPVVTWSKDDRLGLLFRIFNQEIDIEFSLADVEVDPADILQPESPPEVVAAA